MIICSAPTESPGHIMFDCPFAQLFWGTMSARNVATPLVSDAAGCALLPCAPPFTASTLCNGVVFKGLPPLLSLIRKNCNDDAILWRVWLPKEHRCDVDLWLTYFLPERP
jgi:hypothetical protein